MSSALAVKAQPLVVQAEIDFLAPGVERPFTYAHEAPSGGEAETARFASHAVQIQDVRDTEPLRMDEHGAALGWWPTRVRRFYDASHVRRRYYPESADIIKSALRADRVVVFDHNARRGSTLDIQANRCGQTPRWSYHDTCRSISGARSAPRCAMRRSLSATDRACDPTACVMSSCAIRTGRARSTTSCTSPASAGTSRPT